MARSLRAWAINRREKNSVRNFHYGPRTRLVRRIYFVWSVSIDGDCNKRGQTSRAVVGTKIQTSSDFEANLRDCYYLLGCVNCLDANVPLEFKYKLLVKRSIFIIVPSNLNHLLHKDVLHPSSSSSSVTRAVSAT